MSERQEKPTVEDGQIKRLSVSSIAKFDPNQRGGCNRKWWFRYVKGLEEPRSSSSELGASVHKQIEHYLKTGEDVLGDIARAAKPWMPEPVVSAHCVERRFDGELTADGIPLVGYVDLYMPWASPPEVLDWKTTGDMSRALAPHQLTQTIQMSGYGKYALGLHFSADRVRLTHVYLNTRGAPYAEARSVVATRAEIDKRWGEVESVVKSMRGVASEKDVLKIPGNWDACYAFGGCPYRSVCERPMERIISDLFQIRRKDMGLLDVINGTPSPASVALAAEVNAEIARLEAEEAAAITPPDAPASDPALAAMPLPKPEPEAPTSPPVKGRRGRPKKELPREPSEGMVFVDCVVDGIVQTPLSLEPYIRGLCSGLEGQYKAADVRCAPPDSPLGFGKWAGAVAALVLDDPPPKDWYILYVGGCPIKSTVVEALRAAGWVIVRGGLR